MTILAVTSNKPLPCGFWMFLDPPVIWIMTDRGISLAIPCHAIVEHLRHEKLEHSFLSTSITTTRVACQEIVDLA